MRTFLHAVKGIDPVADAFSGTVATDVVSMRNQNAYEFIIIKGVGATGTSTITIEACDDTTPTTTEAIPFHYQAITTGDTHGALTAATTAGFATTAGSSQLYKVYVSAADVASTGYEFVRLKAVEVVDSPVLGGVLILGTEPAIDSAVQPTVIA